MNTAGGELIRQMVKLALGSDLLSDSDGQPAFFYALCFHTIWELINVEAEWDGAWNLSKLHEVLVHQSCYFQCMELNFAGQLFSKQIPKNKRTN